MVSNPLARVAVLASLAFVGSASAAVISTTANTAIPDNGTGLYVNVVDGSMYSGPGVFPTLPGPGANYDFNIFGGTSAWTGFSPGTSGQSAPTPVPTTSKGYVSSTSSGPMLALTPGMTIDGTSTFNTGSPSATAFGTGIDTYFGFRFRNEGPDLSVSTDDTVHYGYALINLPLATLTQNGTLISYAFESTPGVGITIPAIPEPTTLSVLAAAGLLATRRRR